MPDDRRRDDPRPGDPAEGVRIIGAEEAAEALERGDVAARRGSHLPRYGDRPARPPAGSPKPALRFPLEAGADPAESAAVRPARGVRFDPRPPPAWDDPAPAASSGDDAAVDDDEGDWPEASSWAEPADDWGDPKEDVAAWSRGETGAAPVVETGAGATDDELSWADDFVGGEDDPWDGSWDEPTGAVSWADDAAPAAPGGVSDADVAAAVDEVTSLASDDGAEAPADPEAEAEAEAEADEAWAAFVDGDSDDATAVTGAAEDDAGDTVELDGPPAAPDADDPEARAALFDDEGGWAEDSGTVFDFADEPSGQVALPHWTEPATGELPRVLVGDDAAAEGPVTGSTPAVHWRGDDGGWGDGDFDDLAEEGDDVRLGALDDERPHHDDIYSFDDDEDDDLDGPADGGFERRVPPPRPEIEPSSPSQGAGRNVGVAAAVGVGVAAAALVIFAIGSWAAMGLVVVVLTLAVIEYQNAVRRAGYRPAALFGIVAAVFIPLAVYWRGVEAYPLVAVLTVGAALAWHLVGADRNARVVESVGVTLLGVGWIVGFGSFAALLLAQRDGMGLLIAAIVATVGYDVGGFAVGRSMGTRSLSAASPNKTIEGLIGGMLCSLIAMLILGLFEVAPLGAGSALQIGFLAALAAPLGDLCESLVKRDLGVKDMGSLIPEHGGVLDRFDALIFVLPAVYYGAVLFEIGPFS